ncbi:MAG: efflux RND transporter permease subunit, partial [Acidobacteriota bacterium]|nr:efflux RND transporter permease subunit [Acidobacteriota bacterium]
MEALARLATRRPVAVAVFAATVVVLGWIAWNQLPLDLLPDIQSPTVMVSVRSGDRPPTEMERLYGERVEQRLFTVRGIREINQVARTGRLVATVVFDWDTDMDIALVDVQKAVNPIGADPDVEELLVRRFDPRQAPVVTLGLIAPTGSPDLAELRRIARRQVAPALERLEGVAEARVLGGREIEVQIRIDRYRLDAHGLTLGEVESRLRAANVDVAAGTLEEGSKVFLVRGLSRFRRPEDVARVVVRYEQNREGRLVPVHIDDLGEVVEDHQEIRHLVSVDGVEGVGVSIYKEAGSNTVSVSKTVRGALDAVARDLPHVEVVLVADEAGLVEDSIADVQDAALIGVALAVLVLILFLRSIGPTIVVATAVPVSLLAALFLMHVGDRSLNIMTLGGLALGAGMLVDNAIVVVESIFRRRAAGDEPADAAARGTGEVAGAIAASTLTT